MPFQKSGYWVSYRPAAAVRLIIVIIMVTIIVVFAVMVFAVMVFAAMVLPLVVVTLMLVFVLVFVLVLVFMLVLVLVFVVFFFPALLHHYHPFPHLSSRIQLHFPGGATFLDPNPETRAGASAIHPHYLAQGVPVEIPLQRLNHGRG
jgi:amino acid transporter